MGCSTCEKKLTMRKTVLITALICCGVATAQEAPPPLSFDYDASGNQIISALVCVNCPEAATEEHHLEGITYYPNPVVQALNLSWENTENTYMTSVNVYALNGKLITSKKNPHAQTGFPLNFSHKAAGIYVVEVISSDGRKQRFKIIKK